jgi:hypothetical protein
MYQYVPVHLLHFIPNVGLPTPTMVTTRSKTCNVGHRNLPQGSTSQDKKVEPQYSRLTSKEAKQHTNDVDVPVPPINKQTGTCSCVCGFTHCFEHRVIYHMRICPFCKDSLIPVHTTKSLEALTEPSRNPHSLRTSLESSDQTMQFSSHQDLNQEHFNKYIPKLKLKLPKPNNNQQWLTINKELEAVLQM